MNELDEDGVRSIAPWIMAAQDENDADPPLALEHWLAILEGRASLTDADCALLAMSPANRARQAQARYEHRRRFALQLAGNDNRLILKQAASGVRERVDAEPMDDFALYMLPHDENDWMIVVELRDEHPPEGLLVEVIDGDGKVWLCGAPDNRKVVAFRNDVSDPRALLPKLKLRIDDQVID